MEKQYTVEELDEMFSLENLLLTARLEREKKDGLRKLRKEVMMHHEERLVKFESDGLPCVMIRHNVWCGYVGVGQDHPWFGLTANTIIKPTLDMIKNRNPEDHSLVDLLHILLSNKDPTEELPIGIALRVHGGVTFAGDRVPGEKPDGHWWFGFDCGHAGDYSPLIAKSAINKYFPHYQSKGVWRDQQYVVAECQSLAAQLAKIK